MGKVIVYDKKKYFFSYLKKNLRDYSLIRIKKNKAQLTSVKISFVVLYDVTDFLYFFYLFQPDFFIVVCSNDKDMLRFFEDFDNVYTWEISKMKIQLKNELVQIMNNDEIRLL